jgi:SAM-dependent methyltransferase
MPTAPGLEELKERMRRTWMAGDFGQIAQYTAKSAEEFVDRLSISPGMRVLDVACGTGNLALPAARKGAQVTGVDIAANLLDQGRRRADSESLTVVFEEGDAERLPFPEGQFDLVMSMFGAMFAPRPELVASELTRVCRHGGVIAMANWTTDGFVAESFKLGSRYVPPPEGIPAPVLWGDEAIVRERFGASVSKLDVVRREITLDYPFSPREVVQFFRDYFGPTQMTFSRLDAAGQTAYAADLERLWHAHNQSDGKTTITVAYLEVVAIRA